MGGRAGRADVQAIGGRADEPAVGRVGPRAGSSDRWDEPD
ncbi:hypothetical protein SBD_7048 [Streptomyces bottropensis ATCC 25435]|uniref:Uncharacterized protein n=1 Tax=Streptomyces bottropensis ATCC 25435 TaxID=1054862 RepID=M3FH60_9ACTN|nr:hypothetical protein SBD_7048 [Streptomyces bottropensis ATCC 25435]